MVKNRYKNYTTLELAYLCGNYYLMDKTMIAKQMGRTHSTILAMASNLRKSGLFEKYRSIWNSKKEKASQ